MVVESVVIGSMVGGQVRVAVGWAMAVGRDRVVGVGTSSAALVQPDKNSKVNVISRVYLRSMTTPILFIKFGRDFSNNII